MKKGQQKKKRNNKKKKQQQHQQQQLGPLGVVASSCLGCHIVHFDDASLLYWPVFGFDRFDRADFGLGEHDEVPDMSLDEEGVLSVFNPSQNRRKSFYISTLCDCFDAMGRKLGQGEFVDAKGRKGLCTTFILTLGPMSTLAVCRVDGTELFSHVSELPEIAAPGSTQHRFGFPLLGGPFLCSQGRDGQLSHFGVQRFAVDLECEPGTVVVAVGDGQILEVRDSEQCSGSHAENLFHWNSIILQLAGSVVVEYVHIRTGSAKVKAGERVFRGQPLCETGNIGFCPVPHLHFQCHDSSECDAPTVPFEFETDDGGVVFEPKCGKFYSSAKGEEK